MGERAEALWQKMGKKRIESHKHLGHFFIVNAWTSLHQLLKKKKLLIIFATRYLSLLALQGHCGGWGVLPVLFIFTFTGGYQVLRLTVEEMGRGA